MFKEDLLLLTRQNIGNWNQELKNTPAADVIQYFAEKFGDNIVFSSSLSAEDQVITEMIASLKSNIQIFTLDTGRLFQETYDLIQKTQSRYKLPIRVMFPDARRVEKMVAEKGINLFYESVENRKACCQVRKIEPLRRALKGMHAWITGIRQEQSSTRESNQLVEWDSNHNLIKINPLLLWTEKQIWDYIGKKDIPYNKLHDKGYKSIGCLPCTRAVASGEDSRSGRWWWEAGGHKECGLHKP